MDKSEYEKFNSSRYQLTWEGNGYRSYLDLKTGVGYCIPVYKERNTINDYYNLLNHKNNELNRSKKISKENELYLLKEMEDKKNSRRGIFDNIDSNRDNYDSLDDMLLEIAFNTNKTIFFNAPHIPGEDERDMVEENLNLIQTRFNSTVFHPSNNHDVEIILNHRNIKSRVEAIIISGGHGHRNKPGRIGGLDFREITVSDNNLAGKSIYFPDCSLGTINSLNILKRSLGSSASIEAKDFDTNARSVAQFILNAAEFQNRPEELPRLFSYITRARRI